MRRPYDLAAVALILAACLVLVQARWQPPVIDPSQAPQHVGERVRVEGMVIEVRHFSDGGRLVLAAGGAALHARLDQPPDVPEQAWVRAEGTLRREGGLPLLDVERLETVALPAAGTTDLAHLAVRPLDHVDTLVQVRGTVKGPWLEDSGHRMRLVGEAEEGAQTLPGLLRYDAACLCFTFHVPWTPSPLQ